MPLQLCFYNDGITATGINTVTAKADVAKMSLYNNFSSKGELVDAYITARHQEWLDLYQKRLEKTKTAKEAILAVFDAYQDHAEFAYEKGFRGCGLLNAAAEFPANSAGRSSVRQHKEEVEAIVAEHLKKLIPESQRVNYVATQLFFSFRRFYGTSRLRRKQSSTSISKTNGRRYFK